MNLVVAEIQKSWAETKSRPWEVVASVVFMLMIFYLLVGAGSVVSRAALDKAGIYGLLGTFVISLSSFMLFVSLANVVSMENKHGTLEYLMKSQYPLELIVLCQSLLGYFSLLVLLGSMVFLAALISGLQVVMLPAVVVPVLFLVCASCGFGFVSAAIQLLFKSTRIILSFVQFAFFSVGAAPAPHTFLEALIPVFPIAGMARNMFLGRQPDWALLWVAAGASLVYFCIGLVVFRYALVVARRLGNLNHE